VNTDTVVVKSTAMKHIEGGWPKEVDPTEKQDVARFVTKAQKQTEFKEACMAMGPVIEKCMRQNGTTDIYEVYFQDVEADHQATPPSAKSLAVMRDPNDLKRTAAKVAWYPGNDNKVGVAYSVLQFQDKRFSGQRLCADSYIWDITKPNAPERSITPPSPLGCLAFNPKQHDMVCGGSYNGLVSVYDLRKEKAHCGQSEIPTSHHDPVYDVFWISSKTGTQFVSTSTDGRLLYWDTKNLTAPVDEVVLTHTDDVVLGGSCLEYNPEAGATKFLVGTEQGTVMGYNSKQKRVNNGLTAYDLGVLNKHHGPIHAIQRNPVHTKFFMTVGDWTAKIWVEDGKTPILSTTYHDAYLTGGCWSPSRPGVFFLTRADGVVNIWDYNLQQQACVYQHKVGDHPLTSIAVSPANPRLLCVGDSEGTVTLLQVTKSLAELVPGEKSSMGFMFEREALQEKNLMLRDRDLKKERAKEAARKQEEAEAGQAGGGRDEAMENLLREVDAEFMLTIKDAEEKENKGTGPGSKSAGGH
jgi:dynein intermediate chain 2